MKFSKQIAAALAALLLAGMLAAGCGSSDSAPALTKAEFIKQGDAVCGKAEKEKKIAIESFLQDSGAGPEKPLTAAQNEEFVTTAILPPIKVQVEELEALGVPDEQKASDIVEGLGEVVENVEGDPTLLTGKSDVDPFEDVAKKARAYGFKTCILYY
jgi:hypothetical protein